ncbi:flagellar brake domain-containing protein [Motilimonas pumila]|uniref:flagellar brake domain-containing protein n=1 Tax=Motilimonas pumila TaxID=2303987 RepID=UPI0011C3EB56|nr:PilZ domain-containing protein [Motilimonas pumila]
MIAHLQNLQSGDVFDIQFVSQGDVRLKTRLVGFLEGQYFVVSLSGQARKEYRDVLVEGNGLVVRAMAESLGGACIAFKSVVSGVVSKPHGVLFFHYPKVIELINLRQQTRLATHLPVAIFDASDTLEVGEPLAGIIHDISPSGCRLRLKWLKSQGKLPLTQVRLAIQLATREQAMSVFAVVKSQQHDTHTDLSLGLSFIDPDNQRSFAQPELVEIFKKLQIPGY